VKDHIKQSIYKKPRYKSGLAKFKKPPTEDEMDFVQQERDRLCENVFLIQKDMRVTEHIGSHKVTMKAEDKIFNKY